MLSSRSVLFRLALVVKHHRKFVDIIGWSLNYLVQRFWAFRNSVTCLEMQHGWPLHFYRINRFVLDYALIGGLKHIRHQPTPTVASSSRVSFSPFGFLFLKILNTGSSRTRRRLPDGAHPRRA